MPYAEGRTYYDADSHLMELGDWLAAYADPEMRDRIRPLYLGGAGALADEAVRDAEARRGRPESSARARSERDAREGLERARRVRSRRSAAAPSTCSGSSRSWCSARSRRPSSSRDDLELLYGGTRAHNRAMVEFCARRPRLIAGRLRRRSPTPSSRRQAAEEAIAMGCGAILVPSAPPSDRSPDAPDYWPVCGRAGGRAASRSCCTSAAADARCAARSTRTASRPPPTSSAAARTSGRRTTWCCTTRPRSSSRAWCSTASSSSSRAARRLHRTGCAVGRRPLLRRLDIAQVDVPEDRTGAAPADEAAASTCAGRSKFTPFPTEPVGWMIEQAGDRAVLLLVRLPAPRRRPRPARPVRSEPRRRRRQREDAL